MHYYLTCDGWFKYYICVETGKKKFELDKGDIEVNQEVDDFYRKVK